QVPIKRNNKLQSAAKCRVEGGMCGGIRGKKRLKSHLRLEYIVSKFHRKQPETQLFNRVFTSMSASQAAQPVVCVFRTACRRDVEKQRDTQTTEQSCLYSLHTGECEKYLNHMQFCTASTVPLRVRNSDTHPHTQLRRWTPRQNY
ncbi:unnamed protein product, partial [Sphacelaria rigidula]